ncbi:MAG: Asp-tRNA(Asn)/Glu-tRNA(Gln) amidotransferase subunit GatB [Candidatus Babeliaceae bacterium]|jgi:aspartyl-tRNA(Asn)/glutamyl-tRNA(Gln) amidotransferase subunit B
MAEQLSVLERYPDYEITIGIEVHVQLATKSKIFCPCSTAVSEGPNKNICPICAGYPGVLPVLNHEVVTFGIMTGVATNCTINEQSEFARKHYFYPDLPKGYQITQSDKPICSDGFIAIHQEDGTPKQVRLIRIHIEEDAGKNIHSAVSNESFVDLNRAGTPLLEIVSHPDIANAYEARAYLKALHSIVTYINVCSGNMEEGAFRADTNISVRKKGEQKLGTRCELKNINSFKFIGDAIEYEAERQINILESGQKIRQETRLWDTKTHKTEPMRGKEEAADYRYLPEPDLSPIVIEQKTIEEIKKNLPELPDQKHERLKTDYNLSDYEAEILINNPDIANYYEMAAKFVHSKLLINWVLRDVVGYSKESKIELSQLLLTPALLAELVALIENNIINSRTAQDVFAHVITTGDSPTQYVEQHDLKQVGNTAELEKIIQDIITANPQQVAGYKAGKEKLFGFFVGQAMTKTQGKANPQIIQELIKKLLNNA